MRVAVAGAGPVGRSIAQALIADGHEVLIIEQDRARYRPALVAEAHWMLADACEVAALASAGLQTCDVVMAAAGEDRTNLVFALLAKTEFRVPRVVARVNRRENQWLFTPDWGVDVAVSTPAALVSAVGEAVTVGEVVELMTLNQSDGRIVEITLPDDAVLVGRPADGIDVSGAGALVGVVRAGTLLTPDLAGPLRPGDELLFLVTGPVDDRLLGLAAPGGG